ncbi:sugar-binding transcriptional regulator, partial [Thioclava sp. BHET1]
MSSDRVPPPAPSPNRLPLDATRADLMLRAAKLYYELDRTRSQIAVELGLTRWQVSRLLADSRAQGIVRIEIAPRDGRRADLELRLQRELGLADAVVVPVAPGADPATLRVAVGQAAARYLAALAPRPGLIGVSWGRSMAEVARALPPGWNPGARIVLLNGATTLRSASPRTSTVAEAFAASAGGEAVLLPLPAIFGQRATRHALESDPVIAPVLALAAQAEVVCFGMGGLSRGSALVNSGYLDEDDIDRLRAAGAVGDILGRYVDAAGRIVDPTLDA